MIATIIKEINIYQYNDMSSRNFFISEELKEAKEEIEDLKYELDEKDTIIERLLVSFKKRLDMIKASDIRRQPKNYMKMM